MKSLLFLLALAGLMAAPSSAQAPAVSAAPALSPGEIVAAAPPGDWVAIAPADLMVMELAADAKGPSTRSGPRRVVIQLMPAPFSQGWVGNIRKLVAARWYDGVSVNRVQDNYVVQWGDASEKKVLPEGLVTVPETEYQSTNPRQFPVRVVTKRGGAKDIYADAALPLLGWPLAFAKKGVWPVHCYGMVGVGRGLSPDTGSGAELYTVIGHAPRHLDRNIALVGRVIEGIEHLSSLPRGTGALGFYETAEERVPIMSVRMGNEVAGLPAFQYLSTESEGFARYADARANRRDAFFIRPAGGADICNTPVPVRRVK